MSPIPTFIAENWFKDMMFQIMFFFRVLYCTWNNPYSYRKDYRLVEDEKILEEVSIKGEIRKACHSNSTG